MAAFIFSNFALPVYIDDLRVSALVGAGAPVARAAVLVMLRLPNSAAANLRVR